MSDILGSENRRRFFMIAGLIGTGIALALLGLSIVFAPSKDATPSAIKSANGESIKGGAGGAGSAEYNRKVAEYDKQKADTALQAGDSYIATPTGKRSLLTRNDDKKTPQTQSSPVVRPIPVRPQSRPANNDKLKRMLEDLQAMEERLNATMAQGSLFYQSDFSKEVQKEKTVSTTATSTQSSPLPLQTGDILYAVVDTGVNSDVPSAVMATVMTGKYNKTKLIGRFQRHEERLVLAFTNAILPDGSRVQLEAYAIDPETTEGSVASSVDTHFFSRWGGLIAASFLEGLGQAKRMSGATSTLYGSSGTNASDYMLWNDYSLEDQAWIAAGKVGEKSGKIFEKNFDRPPTVYLEAGSAIGVLIMNVKDSKGK